MALSIVTSHHGSQTLRPGQLVCGVVKLETTSESYSESISISFTGHSSVSVIPESGNMAGLQAIRRSCAYLFRRHSILQKEKQLLRKGTYAWPFAFRIPLYATFACSNEGHSINDYFNCESPWRGSFDAESLPLPPSTHHSGKVDCFVRYTLHARLIRPPTAHLFSSSDLAACEDVKIGPLLSQIDRTLICSDWPYNTFRRHFPACTSRRAPPLKSIFQKSKERTVRVPQDVTDTAADIYFQAMIPKVVNVRAHSPVRIFVYATSSKPAGTQNKINIKSFRIDLVIHTKARVDSTQVVENQSIILGQGTCTIPLFPHTPEFDHDSDSSREAKYNHSSVHNDDRGFQDRRMNFTCLEGVTISSLGHEMPPEFSTYNIFRAYTLKFKFKIRYGKVNFTFEEQGVPVKLVDEDNKLEPQPQNIATSDSVVPDDRGSFQVAGETFPSHFDWYNHEGLPPAYRP
jgi:Arrestin (or S-antigen), N-terminal domain